MKQKSLLLIVTGSIAAIKIPELIRMLKDGGYAVRCVLTKGGAHFASSISLESLTGNKVYTELFSPENEAEMSHIRLSRESDLVLVAPASADIMGKMAGGLADDLASTILLATDKQVMIVPAMNVKMWEHKSVVRNSQQLKGDGIIFVGPSAGSLACGEEGEGRMSEPKEIFAAIENYFLSRHSRAGRNRLKGLKALVTAGPTFEAIDPVRYIANRSSGKQGYAIAEALRQAGAEVTLITGPVSLAKPPVKKIIEVQSAAEMHEAAMKNIPADIAVMAAAVADWGIKNSSKAKIKKSSKELPEFKFKENADILLAVGVARKRPKLVIGFAAETENLLANAKKKLQDKKCDWILANDVSGKKVFGKEINKILFVEKGRSEKWPEMNKTEVAEKLLEKIIQKMGKK